MMGQIDPLSQLSLCCGFNNNNRKERKLFKSRQEFFLNPYNPFFGAAEAAAQWPFQAHNPFALQSGGAMQPFMAASGNPQQPYILLSQPVIIATSPVPNQLNTMTLVQHHSQAGPQTASCLQIAQTQQPQAQLQQTQHHLQPHQSLMSGPYAIYGCREPILPPSQSFHRTPSVNMIEANSSNQMVNLQPQMMPMNGIGVQNTLAQSAPLANYASSISQSNRMDALATPIRNRPLISSSYSIVPEMTQQAQRRPLPRSPPRLQLQQQPQMPPMSSIYEPPSMLRPPSRHVFEQPSARPSNGLRQEIFRQLVLIEKQGDLSQDMEGIEQSGGVITRPIEVDSLRPHLKDSMLAKYHSFLNPDEDYVIRFIEIIKKSGQTLGLYIRSVQIRSPMYANAVGPLPSRTGLIITKIESDSPVYNSQVLRVGDEILSVNLVDVEGMSLDDVVIIMSLPKRLVLAIRVPSYREEAFSAMSSARAQLDHHIEPMLLLQRSTYTPNLNDISMNRMFGDNVTISAGFQPKGEAPARPDPMRPPRPGSSSAGSTLVNPHILDNPLPEFGGSKLNSDFPSSIASVAAAATNNGSLDEPDSPPRSETKPPMINKMGTNFHVHHPNHELAEQNDSEGQSGLFSRVPAKSKVDEFDRDQDHVKREEMGITMRMMNGENFDIDT